ncbi:MAG: hypothetical protein IH991_16235 [Planctomycetes bacterium]|nr:hypothetical protein [Planctomycetota bacterium]
MRLFGGSVTLNGGLIATAAGDFTLSGNGFVTLRQTILAEVKGLLRYTNNGIDSDDVFAAGGTIAPLKIAAGFVKRFDGSPIAVVRGAGLDDVTTGNESTDLPPVDSSPLFPELERNHQDFVQEVAAKLRRIEIPDVELPDIRVVRWEWEESGLASLHDAETLVSVPLGEGVVRVGHRGQMEFIRTSADGGYVELISPSTAEPIRIDRNVASVVICEGSCEDPAVKTVVDVDWSNSNQTSPSGFAQGVSSVVTSLFSHYAGDWIHEHVDEGLLGDLLFAAAGGVIEGTIGPIVASLTDDIAAALLGSEAIRFGGSGASTGLSLGAFPWSTIAAVTPLITNALDLPPNVARAVNTTVSTLSVAAVNPPLAPIVLIADIVVGELLERQAEKKRISFQEAVGKWWWVAKILSSHVANTGDPFDDQTHAFLQRLSSLPGHPQDMENHLTPFPGQYGALLGEQVLAGRAVLPVGDSVGVTGPWNDQDASSIAQYWIRSSASRTYDIVFTEALGLSFHDGITALGFDRFDQSNDQDAFNAMKDLWESADWLPD